jgi:NAD(P)-dependent dehydrogenase (short-subunit alcohol dehydrogenase family)
MAPRHGAATARQLILLWMQRHTIQRAHGNTRRRSGSSRSETPGACLAPRLFPAGDRAAGRGFVGEIASLVRRQQSASRRAARAGATAAIVPVWSLWEPCMALELASENIRVNALCPVARDTPVGSLPARPSAVVFLHSPALLNGMRIIGHCQNPVCFSYQLRRLAANSMGTETQEL